MAMILIGEMKCNVLKMEVNRGIKVLIARELYMRRQMTSDVTTLLILSQVMSHTLELVYVPCCLQVGLNFKKF